MNRKALTRPIPRFVITALVVGIGCHGGCHIPRPGGHVIEPQILGSQVDHIHRIQEENAELAKLIVYTHEFEINLQEENLSRLSDDKSNGTFDYQDEPRPHGLRLTPDGLDHVRQIASVLTGFETLESSPMVVVERSTTSKRWDTEHHYPVHFNEELDELRRLVVVGVLESLGVADAERVVVVAPAFPTGLNARDAAAAYQTAILGNALTHGSRSGRSTSF